MGVCESRPVRDPQITDAEFEVVTPSNVETSDDPAMRLIRSIDRKVAIVGFVERSIVFILTIPAVIGLYFFGRLVSDLTGRLIHQIFG